MSNAHPIGVVVFGLALFIFGLICTFRPGIMVAYASAIKDRGWMTPPPFGPSDVHSKGYMRLIRSVGIGALLTAAFLLWASRKVLS